VIVSRLSFASVYSTICTKYIVIAYKICYKGSLDFGIPGVIDTFARYKVHTTEMCIHAPRRDRMSVSDPRVRRRVLPIRQ